MARRTPGSLALALLIAAALLIPSLQLQPAAAQPPRWSMKLLFLPWGLEELLPPEYNFSLWLWDPGRIGPGDEETYRYGKRFVPGEAANLTFQIVNTDCSRREEEPRIERFERAWLDEVEPIFGRAHRMNRTGFIKDYEIFGYDVEGFGERLRADWELRIYGYCAGEAVYVEAATVWFAWPGIGKAHNVSTRIGRSLEALDPISYILRRGINSSIAFFTVRFGFPHNVPPDSLRTQPTVTLRMRYPGGFTYEYDYEPAEKADEGLDVWGIPRLVYGRFMLYPYRTFSLQIRDHEGGIALPGAAVRFKAHVYPFELNATAGEDGALRVWRLPDYYTYEVKVNYTVPWLGEERRVLVGGPYEAYKLALAGELRTELYTLRIAPLDRQGRALEGARVTVRPEAGRIVLENSTARGYASFYLLPTGNYSIAVEWRGVEVFRAHRHVGVHPTLGFPPTSFSIEAAVDDLKVTATDMAGNPVGATFTVRGPTPESSFSGIEAPDGLLRLEQMPIADYVVSATNRSEVWGSYVEAEEVARPGEPLRLMLPIFGVTLKAVSMDGKPLQGASITLHTVRAVADARGLVTFPGVPAGSYGVEASYRGVTVYRGSVEVSRNVEEPLRCEVYDIRVRFEAADGRPLVVEWRLSGPAGSFEGRGEAFALELLPEGAYRLSAAYIREGKEVRLLEEEAYPSRLRDATIRLPIGDLRVRVAWDDGTPFEGEARILGEGRRVEGGRLTVPLLPFGSYGVSIVSGGVEVLRSEVAHGAGEAVLTIPTVTIVVRVVDALGRPVEGAAVSLQSPRVPGGTLLASATGREGSASFARAPANLAPYWVSVTYAGQRLEQQALPGENTVALPGIEVGGVLIELWHLLLVAAALATTLAVALLLMRARRRGEGEERPRRDREK